MTVGMTYLEKMEEEEEEMPGAAPKKFFVSSVLAAASRAMGAEACGAALAAS